MNYKLKKTEQIIVDTINRPTLYEFEFRKIVNEGLEKRLKVFKGRKRIKIPAEWNKLRE